MLAALAAVALPAPAGAYVRYRYNNVPSGAAYYWNESCETVSIYLNGFTQMTPNEVAKSVAAAAHTWSPSEVTCGSGATATHPYLEIVPTLKADSTPPPPVAYDARNSLVFRTELWQMSGKASGKLYAYNALAITSVYAKPDGHIVDADIEVNAATDKVWANLDDPSDAPSNVFSVYDLQTTLTHEFGHFVGLDHTCWMFDPSMPLATRPMDDMGNPVPDCDTAPPAIQATVMFSDAAPFDITKRSLTSDEIRAMCDIYPPEKDRHICALDVPNDGCTVAAPPARPADARPRGHAGVAIGAAAVALGLVWSARSRSRRRAR
jgi:hypothetical protein